MRLALIVLPILLTTASCLDLSALQSCTYNACPTDGGGADLRGEDLRGDAGHAADLAQPVTGCASGVARPVTATMTGCLGAWGSGGPATLCAAGWSLCTMNTAGSACQVNLPSTEIYVSAATQGQATPHPWTASAACSWAGVPSAGLRGVGVCGNGVPNIDGPPNVAPCASFPATLTCWNNGGLPSGAVVSCPYTQSSDADLSGLLNLAPTRVGALCCSP